MNIKQGVVDMKTILYDCDNQVDFYPGGALAVTGADVIRQNLAFLTRKAIRENIQIVASMDTHTKDDPEFQVFPPHCVRNMNGWTKIPETECGSYVALQHDDIISDNDFDFQQIILEKATYNIWDPKLGQPKNLTKILEHLGVEKVVMTGVATNICVKAAVMGLLERHYQVYLVHDAIKGLFIDDKNNEEVAIQEMIAAGAILTNTASITF
jgi:nicotinamidase/pyrazinamidase